MAGNIARAAVAAALSICPLLATPALAWDDEGHKIVALIADHYLDPAVKKTVESMLAADPDPLTPHDIASAATWADRFRESDHATTRTHYNATRQWHWIDIEIDHPDIDSACFNHPAIPAGTPVSQGPAQDCILDKITGFAAELKSPETAPAEKLLALKFLLHFVGDLHAPLHAGDNHDKGGSDIKVTAAGGDPGTLHHYWNQDFLDYLGDDPAAVADDLVSGITQSKTYGQMSAGTPADWAMESFALARDHAYGKLPAKKPDGTYELPPSYTTDAIETIRLQLARAGARLAALLNASIAH